jgi:type I restriction enzyme, S subunit
VTTEAFFKRFDQFAGAPNATVKFRELVLELATNGRMLEQNPKDQTAEELIKEIQLIRDGQKGRQRTPKGSFGTMITAGDTIELPSSWSRCMISELCDLQTGATPSRQEAKYFGGNVLWLVSGDINKREIFDCEGRITKAGMDNSNCKLIPANSVLIALNGQGKTRGTVALLRIEAALYQSLVAIIPYSRELLLPEFLYWNLRGRYYHIREITGQDQRRGLNMKLVGQLSIPVPPLAEQKRIVAKVDELMALCDRFEAQEAERKEKGQRLSRAALAQFTEKPTAANLGLIFHMAYEVEPGEIRKAILELAVRGKLVGQDPKDEPADMLLDQIKLEKTRLLNSGYPNILEAGNQLRKQSVLILPDNIKPLPVGWIWETLIQVSLLIVDCHNKTAPYTKNGIRLLRTTNIRNGQLNLNDPKNVSEETYQKWTARCKPEQGDILITREAPMGEVCIIPEGMKICMGQRMLLIRVLPRLLDVRFVLYSLMDPKLLDRVQDKPVGATVQHLRVGGVETLLFPLPPLAEQKRIVAKVDEMMALVDKLEAQQAQERVLARRLLEAAVREMTA